jgi:hypothetical protein
MLKDPYKYSFPQFKLVQRFILEGGLCNAALSGL